MAKFTAIEPLLLKTGRVEPGESVELGEGQAKQLLALGAVKAATQPKPKAPDQQAAATKPD